MESASFEPWLTFFGDASVSYSPHLDQSGKFGPWEVHPNKVKVTKDGSVSLEWNGEYLAIGYLVSDDGSETILYSLACCGVKPNISACESAEMLCALRNGDMPTRVIDFCGNEYVSKHSASALESRMT